MENKFFRILSIISLSVLVMFSCEDEKKDVEDTVVPTPIITSIDPAEGYPGEEATITGENFNATTSSNLIEIDTNDVSLASVTPSAGTTTSLTFTRPNVSGVGVTINATLKVRNVEDVEEKVSESIAISLLPVFDIITVAGLDSVGSEAGNQLYGPKTKGGLAFDADGTCMHAGKIQQKYIRSLLMGLKAISVKPIGVKVKCILVLTGTYTLQSFGVTMG